jgi:hypothetical protein
VITPALESDPASYVASVLILYADLPETPLCASVQDRWQARRLQDRGVSLPLVESALLLRSLRRLIRPADLPPLPPIRSLAYFQPVIDELLENPPPDKFLGYLRLKMRGIGWQQTPGGCSEKDVLRRSLTLSAANAFQTSGYCRSKSWTNEDFRSFILHRLINSSQVGLQLSLHCFSGKWNARCGSGCRRVCAIVLRFRSDFQISAGSARERGLDGMSRP